MIDLMSRKSNGIEVVLYMERETEKLYVSVEDQHTGEEWMVPVKHADAMLAFDHPYAYREPSYVPTHMDRMVEDQHIDPDDEWGALA